MSEKREVTVKIGVAGIPFFLLLLVFLVGMIFGAALG